MIELVEKAFRRGTLDDKRIRAYAKKLADILPNTTVEKADAAIRTTILKHTYQ